ncbi:hypothetical protein K469DRAFT_656370 [Zopfia rhizophila CBS 207.26]|uniref:Uncharacterized protein n=1 Tax=Zopfia rhizophila CBS 207.26 TaxID=1314779 RepID=A0A6A6EL03_9PEZI|nr:hypothetical protein K469DRAFT_656370 [Zopfia rhizophila CBS 207.26]
MPPESTTNDYIHRHSRARSRSLYRHSHRKGHHSRRPRSRSRSPHQEEYHRHKRRRSPSPPPRPVVLPFKARKLCKHDFEEYRPLFASYLDIQKQIYIDDLDGREVKGRWKSFVGRWNRGDLAEGWYDPMTLQKAKHSENRPPERNTCGSPDRRPYGTSNAVPAEPQSDDDDFGPALPQDIAARRTGPTIPRMEDLALRDELREEDMARNRTKRIDDIRYERKWDRKAQKERLEELVPRAHPGTRERQLEKKSETTNTLRDFRDAKESGDVEVGEADLMGDDGMEAYKKRKVELERKKNEREIRKEEIMRAKAAEREEKLAEHRAKEEKTMEYLKAIARDRFG